MMKVEHIKISVDKEGSISVEPQNYKGKACVKETQAIEAKLGGDGKRTLTAAFYEKVKSVANNILGGGR